MSQDRADTRVGIVPVTLPDRHALYSAYMPFLKNGGLFVSTPRTYRLGEEVILILSLLEETERFSVPGKVVWITPKAAEGYRTPGIGVQFKDEETGATRARIENYLAGSVEAERPTYTM